VATSSKMSLGPNLTVLTSFPFRRKDRGVAEAAHPYTR
jgi:hypothetical protein